MCISLHFNDECVFVCVADGIQAGAGRGTQPQEGLALALTMDSQNQQFCLKWNSFGSNLATAFGNLFKSESLTDVTLFCDGKCQKINSVSFGQGLDHSPECKLLSAVHSWFSNYIMSFLAESDKSFCNKCK